MRSTSIPCFVAILFIAAVRIAAMPVEDPNGPWSRADKPPYPLPDVGPEELPPDYFDQFKRADALPEQVREFWREKYRVERKELLEKLARMRPETPPPLSWARDRAKRLSTELRTRVKASISWRLGARQRLEERIEKEKSKRIQRIKKACRLRAEADECDRRAIEAEKNIEEWTKLLEATQGNDILPELEQPLENDSGQFKAMFTDGLGDAIKGAGSRLGHILNDAGSRLSNSPQPGRWQRVPPFKPVSPIPGSLV